MTDKTPITNRRNTTVVLFGEILFDMFPDRSVLGGAPFNVACHLQAFGLKPVLISRTGKDTLSREIVTRMTTCKMDTQGLQSDSIYPTGTVLIHLKNGNHRFEILPDQAYDFIDAQAACDTTRTIVPNLIYYGTLAQRHPVSRKALDTLLNASEAPHFLDINLRTPWYNTDILHSSLTQADIVKLNLDELYQIGALLEFKEIKKEDLSQALMKNYNLMHLLVTCGDAGAWLMHTDGHVVEAPAGQPLEIIDTVGAGDAFSAVFILGLFSNWPMVEILTRADTFARSICEIRGAVPDDDSFYTPFRAAWNTTKGALP